MSYELKPQHPQSTSATSKAQETTAAGTSLGKQYKASMVNKNNSCSDEAAPKIIDHPPIRMAPAPRRRKSSTVDKNGLTNNGEAKTRSDKADEVEGLRRSIGERKWDISEAELAMKGKWSRTVFGVRL